MFNGRFVRVRPEKLIGKGSFKMVYLATDMSNGSKVAWCEMTPFDNARSGGSECAPRDAWDDARAEISMLSNLSHPNIVKILDWDADEETGRIVLIAEYMEEGSLRRYASRLTAVSDASIAQWTLQALRGLVYMHALCPPVVHRDVKADNLFVTKNMRGEVVVKVGDVGLCSLVRSGDTEKIRTLVGTPAFIAPEMYDEVYNCKVDVWAFGMTLLELRTGKVPYSECNNIAQIYRKVSFGCCPNSLRTVPPGKLKDVIEMCTRSDPRQRPSASEIMEHDFFRESSDGASTNGGNDAENLQGDEEELASLSYAASVKPSGRYLW